MKLITIQNERLVLFCFVYVAETLPHIRSAALWGGKALQVVAGGRAVLHLPQQTLQQYTRDDPVLPIKRRSLLSPHTALPGLCVCEKDYSLTLSVYLLCLLSYCFPTCEGGGRRNYQ